MAVMTKQHTWVKHTITAVEILEDTDGSPVVMVDPDQQELAEEDAAYGCNVCGKSLVGNFNTECEGPNND